MTWASVTECGNAALDLLAFYPNIAMCYDTNSATDAYGSTNGWINICNEKYYHPTGGTNQITTIIKPWHYDTKIT